MKTTADSAMQSSSPERYAVHLSEAEYDVIVHKGTDRPGDGGYTNVFDEGVYHCRACGNALYKSETKFHSGCGWPSFETEIAGSVRRNVDRSYGMMRTEIVCANCGGHLGHEFQGERITPANNRHCVNTSSIVFHPAVTRTVYVIDEHADELQFALYNKRGVLFTRVGEYAAGAGTSASGPALEISIDPSVASLDSLLTSTVPSTQRKVVWVENMNSAHGGAEISVPSEGFRAFGPERQHRLLRASRSNKQ